MIDKNDEDTVSTMLENHEENKQQDDHTATQSVNTSLDLPEDTEHEVPEDAKIGIGGKIHGTHSILEKKCRKYAKKFIEGKTEYQPLPIDMTDIEWRVDASMTKALGRCKYRKPSYGMCRVKLSKHLFDNDNWDQAKQTIRHELVHVWQWQTDNNPGHGLSFQRWTGKLDISTRAENPPTEDFKYEVHCPNCGQIGGRQKRCKSLRQIVNRDQRYCSTCGKEQTQGELYVIHNGERMTYIN